MVQTSKSGRAVGFGAWYSKRNPDVLDPAPTDYTEYYREPSLIPMSLSEQLAPNVSRAKFAVDFATAGIWPWQWWHHFAADDRVKIISLDDNNAGQFGHFGGFLVDSDWGVSGADSANMNITAVGNAFRLLRDVGYLVHGRYMLDKNEDVSLFTGLPCVFNPDGRPNMHHERLDDLPDAFPVTTGRNIAVFTHDDDPRAKFWTIGDIIDYLSWRYNADETWLVNPMPTAADYNQTSLIRVACEGIGLWQAFAAVGDAAGYDVAEKFVYGAGEVTSQIIIKRKHSGTVRSLRRQSPSYSGVRPTFDPAKTQTPTMSLAESVASCVTVPTIAGGRELVEATFTLLPCFDFDDLPDDSDVIFGGANYRLTKEQLETDYGKNYCVGGSDFADYNHTARLWCANEDGAFTTEPYEHAIPDMAALAAAEAGTWPVMAYPAAPCIDILREFDTGEAIKEKLPIVLRISIDGGTTYYNETRFKILKNRLGVYLDFTNPAGYVYGDNPKTGNLIYALNNAPDDVIFKLTCSVLGPNRGIFQPDQQPSGGTAFKTTAWIDAGTLGQVRTLTGSSVYGPWVNTFRKDVLNTDSAEKLFLKPLAQQIVNANQDRFIEADFSFEWSDAKVNLCDCIDRITGIDYPLGTNTGAAVRFPRVIQINRHYQQEAATIILDTDRKATLI